MFGEKQEDGDVVDPTMEGMSFKVAGLGIQEADRP